MALAASACTGDGSDPAPTTTEVPTTTTVPERVNDGVLSIGVFLPRTGPGAPFGEPMIAAIEDDLEHINELGGALGQDVEHVIVDEGSGTIEQLLDEGVDAIVGPASSAVALTSLGPAVDAITGVVVCSPMATTLLLDDYPEKDLLFRTAPSDSLQMAAIARQAERTGAQTVAIGYLDDPYGRGLEQALREAIDSRPVPGVSASVGFGFDEEDLTDVVAELLADDPGVVVVLGPTDDGSRLLSAIDQAVTDPPPIIVNDSIRQARQIIQSLSPQMRNQLIGVAPKSSAVDGEPEGFFVAHAVDCVNLIVLAALAGQSDNPTRIRAFMPAVSTGGRICNSYEACAVLIEQGLGVDYNGLSGAVDLSTATGGDLTRAWFELFGFDANGNEVPLEPFEISL
jgi:branched-chain amino acid transport system substrate-binding protein